MTAGTIENLGRLTGGVYSGNCCFPRVARQLDTPCSISPLSGKPD